MISNNKLRLIAISLLMGFGLWACNSPKHNNASANVLQDTLKNGLRVASASCRRACTGKALMHLYERRDQNMIRFRRRSSLLCRDHENLPLPNPPLAEQAGLRSIAIPV